MIFYRKYEKAILASTKASEIESSRPRFIQVFCFHTSSTCFVFTCGKNFCFRMIVKSSQHRYVQVFCFNMPSRCFVFTCGKIVCYEKILSSLLSATRKREEKYGVASFTVISKTRTSDKPSGPGVLF